MTTHERRQKLIELLRRQPGMRVPEIATTLDVSEGTVRNDLNALEEEGRLERVHGGAVLREQKQIDSTSFTERHLKNRAEKEAIARQAAQLVKDGDSILLDASSSVYYLGLALENHQRLRVVTNGLDVARLLARNPSNSVVLVGGILDPDGTSLTGLFSEESIQKVYVQKAFVSASGFSLERGLTEVHLEEAQLKRKAIASTNQLIALIDSDKLGHEDMTPFAAIDKISTLYTDAGISPDWVQKLNAAQVDLVVCDLE